VLRTEDDGTTAGSGVDWTSPCHRLCATTGGAPPPTSGGRGAEAPTASFMGVGDT
jgi:hypothetical protein